MTQFEDIKFVAEMSGNHLGSKDRAIEMIHAAAGAGATHVKFQAYTPTSMVCDPTYEVPDGPWKGRNLYDLYKANATPFDWFQDLFREAWGHGIVPFASVFCGAGLDMLEDLNCPIYKIASFELGHYDLISRVAETGKPMVLSTGLATDERLAGAVLAADSGDLDLTILQCTSAYPASIADANLSRLLRLIARYPGTEVGVSDHSASALVPMLAVTLGATMIEQHFRSYGAPGGDDHDFSQTPEGFRGMVNGVRAALEALGDGLPSEAEWENRALLRRLWVTKPIAVGEMLTRDNIGVFRGGDGPLGEQLDFYLGTKVIRPLVPGPFAGGRTIP